jgi:uncharacterized protein (PEP-CTERM system associated)
MTITTAKRADRALLLTPLALAALLLSAECRADVKFTPSIGVSETYSDNPGLQRDEEAHGQWISEATPAFTLTSHTHRLRLSAFGEWHFYGYQDKNTPRTHDRERRYSANADATLIDDLLSLQTGASGSRQAISAFGPRFTAPYSTANRTDIQTWSISPVLQHRFGSSAELQARLTRDAVTTEGEGNGAAFGDSHSTTGLVNLFSPSGANKFGWSLQYMHQNLDTNRFGSSIAKNATANLRYRFTSDWSAVASVSHESYEYPAVNSRTSGPRYVAGVIWTPSIRTSIDARLGHGYLGKTGSLAAVQGNRRLVSRVSYTDQVMTTREQFLLPAAIDTAAMLDQLFSRTITDPAVRAQAVQAYMATTGLPSTLANNINYLSNRYMRDKRLQAALIYNLPHSTMVLSAYRSERNALSLQQSDSELLGSQLSSLNDNVRQRGFDGSFNYRLSSRTTANLMASASRATSITTGIVTPNRIINLGLTHQFDRKTRGILAVRHLTSSNGVGPSAIGAGPGISTENAVTATLSVQL